MSREIGSLLGDYRIIGRLGRGGAGEVFRVEHVITHRIEALKLLARGRPATAEEELRFLREIELQAGLHHPNIAAVLNACSTPEGLALAMELVDGEPLSAILARGGVALRDGIRYMRETLDALAYAHAHSVVHRDVKPGNILITADGSVKLTDFGLAHSPAGPELSASGVPAGSPYYMSPEQVLGTSPADARSDCYSAGVVLYEIATGRRPFEGQSGFDVMVQQREAAPAAPLSIAPHLGCALNDAILKAMEKDPARRFQSAAEFRAALDGALEILPAAPARTQFREAARWIATLVAPAMVAGFALMVSLHRAKVAPPASPPAVHRSVLPQLAPPPAPVPVAAPVPGKPEKIAVKKPAAARRQSRSPALPVRESAAAPSTAPPEIPLPPPAASDAPAAPPAIGSEEAPPAEPAKRRNFLRRALNRIIHPRGAPKPQVP